MSAYDNWLEAPYVNASIRSDAFEKWCEENDEDSDSEAAWERFDEAQANAEQDYWEGVAEDRAEEARYE